MLQKVNSQMRKNNLHVFQTDHKNYNHSLQRSIEKSTQKLKQLSKSKSKQNYKKQNLYEIFERQQAQKAKIYFDSNLKKQYMKNIVNKYFVQEDNQKSEIDSSNKINSTIFINKRKFTQNNLYKSQKLNNTIDHPEKIRFSVQLPKKIQIKKQGLTKDKMKFPILKRNSLNMQMNKPNFFKTINNEYLKQEQHIKDQAKISNITLQKSLNFLKISQQHKTLDQRQSIKQRIQNQILMKNNKKLTSINSSKEKQKHFQNLTKSIILQDQQSTNQDHSFDTDNLSHSNQIQFQPSDIKSFSIGSSMSSIFLKSLPPIHQQFESNAQNVQDVSSKYHYDNSHIKQNISLTEVKTIQTKIFQNNSFIILKIQTQKISSQKPSIKRKENFFKKIYKPSSIQLLQRQLKAKKIGVDLLWEQLQFQKHCLKVKGYPNMSKLLIKISKIQQTNQKSYLLIKPRSYHKKLFQNNCKQMIRIIKQICISLLKVEGKLINNRINLNNIFLVNNYKISIGEWAYSSFRTQYNIQDKQFQKRLTPILKNQNQWFCTPQYLAPQLLKDLSNDIEECEKKLIQKNEQYDPFQFGNISDVWSLGLMIFQMITLIPVWINERCIVSQTKNPKIIPRKGIFSVKDRKLRKIIEKQLKINQTIQKLIDLQCQNYEINSKILQLLHRMIQPNPQKRISLTEILEQIQKI